VVGKKRGRLDAVNNSGKETAAIIRKERERGEEVKLEQRGRGLIEIRVHFQLSRINVNKQYAKNECGMGKN